MATCCGLRSDNKPITAATIKQNHAWSGKNMEGHNGLDTLECLRGRLLAERHASRVAKEEAESLGNKFVELEKKLKEEIKLRDKAERKLKLLKKKLECFNNVTTPSWQKSPSSEICEDSCGSSLCSAVSRDSEANETKLVHTVNPALLENEVHNHYVAEECVLVQTHNSPLTTKDCNSDQSTSSLKFWAIIQIKAQII